MTSIRPILHRIKRIFRPKTLSPVYFVGVIGLPMADLKEKIGQCLAQGPLLKRGCDLIFMEDTQHNLTYALFSSKRQGRELCRLKFIDSSRMNDSVHAKICFLDLEGSQNPTETLESLTQETNHARKRFARKKIDLILVLTPIAALVSNLPVTEERRLKTFEQPTTPDLSSGYLRSIAGLWVGRRLLHSVEHYFRTVLYKTISFDQKEAAPFHVLDDIGITWLLQRWGYLRVTIPQRLTRTLSNSIRKIRTSSPKVTVDSPTKVSATLRYEPTFKDMSNGS